MQSLATTVFLRRVGTNVLLTAFVSGRHYLIDMGVHRGIGIRFVKDVSDVHAELSEQPREVSPST
jgi:hypothetical protein